MLLCFLPIPILIDTYCLDGIVNIAFLHTSYCLYLLPFVFFFFLLYAHSQKSRIDNELYLYATSNYYLLLITHYMTH